MSDWGDLRFLLEVARTGSLAAASRKLGVDSSTVSRRISVLEEQLGAKIFSRTPDGLVATAAGEAMRGAAEEMEQAMLRGEQRALGADRRLAGMVRIATTESLAQLVVLPALQALRSIHPLIRCDLFTGTGRVDLERREADVALRYVRPSSGELVARRAGTVAFAAYASKKYLARRGKPVAGTAFAGHDLIAFDVAIRSWRQGTLVGEPLRDARIVLRVNSTGVILESVRLGLGIGPLPCAIADGDRLLQRVLPEAPLEQDDLWLVMHPDVARTMRVRAVLDAIEARLKSLSDRLSGKR
jgi:DNA-binding transcriptional LysR family regulator